MPRPVPSSCATSSRFEHALRIARPRHGPYTYIGQMQRTPYGPWLDDRSGYKIPRPPVSELRNSGADAATPSIVGPPLSTTPV